MNEKHLKILAEVSNVPEYLIKDGTIKYFDRDQIFAAMQKLQEEIDALKLREEKLMQDINDQAERNRPDWDSDSDSDSPSHYGYNW